MELELDSIQIREEKGPKHRNGRAFSRKMKRRRLVDKRGRIHVNYVNVPDRGQLYYLSDHFTTLIEAQWRYVILIFSLSFIVSWLVFGTIWWGIYSYRKKYHDIECIEKVDSWTSAFLFSLETQTTIGYGGRQVTPHCPEGVICLLIQCIIGLLISSTMLGLIFAKLSRPHKRRCTILFSRHAVIGPRNGKLYLMMRIADLRKRQLIESHIRVFLIDRYVSREKEKICCFRQPLSITCDKDDDDDEKIFLFAPVVLLHEINEQSPFYDYSPDDLLLKDFEIVVLLEGIVEPTGMTMQARTSYVGDEIHWGHLFVDIMKYRDTSIDGGYYDIDISRFHETFEVELPRGTARAEAQEKDVPEDTDVYLNVKLIDMYPASPEDDSQKNWAHRVQELEWRRTNGNDHYRRRNMQLAARCYEKGMEVFPETPVQAPTSVGLSGKAAAAAVTKTIADVASNLSAVYLEQGRARDASDHAKIAVDLVPKHAKAIFRLAKASFLLGDFEECQARINELQGLQFEEDAAVKRLVADLERARTKHASKSKKLGAALLEAAGEGREYVEKPPPEEPPTFLQELLEPMIPSKKQVILLGALVMLSALVIFFAPQRHRPQVVIISLLASTLIFAIYTAVTQADADIAEAKKK